MAEHAKKLIERSQFIHGKLADGTAVVVNMKGAQIPCTVWTVPAAGDTVTVSYSVDGGVTYTVWPPGAVIAASNDTLVGPVTDIKFQRTAGAGTTSTYGIAQ